MKKIMALCFVIATLTYAYSSADEYSITIQPFTHEQINKALESHGDEAVLDYIMADPVMADKLFKGIKSGKDEWLNFIVPSGMPQMLTC